SVAMVVVLGHQREQLWFEVPLFAARVLGLMAGVYFKSAMVAIASYSTAGLLMNIAFIGRMFAVAHARQVESLALPAAGVAGVESV
ncbi:MAG TPA: hypothetical protein VF493_21960, partial [Terriglobales bacterium]